MDFIQRVLYNNSKYDLPTEMDYFISITAGFLFKTADEMEDIDFIESSNYKEYLKILSITVFSILFLKNIPMTLFICLFLIPICYYLKQIDTPYWKSLVPLPYLALLLHMVSIEEFSTLDIISNFIFFMICAAACVVEAAFFPEEISLVKVATRLILIFVFSSIIFFLNPAPSTTHILCLCIGYCLASTLIKLLVLNPEEILPAKEYEKFSNSNVDEILEEEIPVISNMILEAIRANKDAFAKVLTTGVILFHTLVNKKSDESQLEICIQFFKTHIIKVSSKLELHWLSDFIETFPDFYIPNLEVEKTKLLSSFSG